MIKLVTRTVGAIAVACLLAGPAFSQDDNSHTHSHEDMAADDMTDMDMMMAGPSVMVGPIELAGAFTRAMPPASKAGGGFVTITNHSGEADRLISASSPSAGLVELHEMKMDGDVMLMREMEDGIEIPAGGMVLLAPGGLHVMFMQVPTPFVEGEEVKVTLEFEKAGTTEIVMKVAPIGAKGLSY